MILYIDNPTYNILNMTKPHQYRMGIVGNCSYLSYIDDHANVVWQCWPFFDSSFIFGGLMDEEKGGCFSVTPAGNYTTHQYYLDNTNILVTQFECQDGSFRVIDFAPRFENFERMHRPLQLFRKIERVAGNPAVIVKCRPMGKYGEVKAEPQVGSNSINYSGLERSVRLTTNISKTHILNETSFILSENNYMVLSYGNHLEAPLESTFEEFYRKTKHYWRKWIERSTTPYLYQREVIRSALLLKLHQYEDTGAFIAAGTTSLPEHPGSGRNWDYRYCWVRDSYFTLAALNSLSHFSEIERYSHFIQNIVQQSEGHFQPVYKIDGSSTITETEIDLKGYLGNSPVRIGNLAYQQIQNDVYGQILLSLLPLYTDLRVHDSSSKPSLGLIEKVLNKIEETMDAPDAGIWEYRGKKQKHCETFLFHWVGCKAAAKIAKHCMSDKLLRKANELTKKSEANIETCYREAFGAYSMAHENENYNAAEFLLINMYYLDPSQEKSKRHLQTLEKELKANDFLIYRYRDADDFGDTQSSFLICGFWYAEALATVGRIDDAQKVFEKLLGTANHLGIFSEDVCPKDQGQWGNFGQTYSHVGLINTAFKISQKLDRPSYL